MPTIEAMTAANETHRRVDYRREQALEAARGLDLSQPRGVGHHGRKPSVEEYNRAVKDGVLCGDFVPNY